MLLLQIVNGQDFIWGCCPCEESDLQITLAPQMLCQVKGHPLNAWRYHNTI